MEREEVSYCSIQSGVLDNFTGKERVSIENMRKFHNWVKESLIKKAVSLTDNTNLLDLAVGRGGDIMKWHRAGIKNVTGIDNHKPSLFSSIERGGEFDGAISRLRSSRIRTPYARFYHLNVLDHFLNKEQSYSVKCYFQLRFR